MWLMYWLKVTNTDVNAHPQTDRYAKHCDRCVEDKCVFHLRHELIILGAFCWTTEVLQLNAVELCRQCSRSSVDCKQSRCSI